MEDHDQENVVIDQDQTRITPKDDDGVGGPSSEKQQIAPPPQAADAELMDVYIPIFIDDNRKDDSPMSSFTAQFVLDTIDKYEAHGDDIEIDEYIKFLLDNRPHGELRADMQRIIEQNEAREAAENEIFAGLPDLFQLDTSP